MWGQLLFLTSLNSTIESKLATFLQVRPTSKACHLYQRNTWILLQSGNAQANIYPESQQKWPEYHPTFSWLYLGVMRFGSAQRRKTQGCLSLWMEVELDLCHSKVQTSRLWMLKSCWAESGGLLNVAHLVVVPRYSSASSHRPSCPLPPPICRESIFPLTK